MDLLTPDDIETLCLGATLLGAGGGGDPYVAKLVAQQALETYGPVRVVNTGELPPDALVLTTAVIWGADGHPREAPRRHRVRGLGPGAGLLSGPGAGGDHVDRGGRAQHAAAHRHGRRDGLADRQRRLHAPGVPADRDDGLSRWPACRRGPLSIADEKGNQCVFRTTDNHVAERLARAAVIQLGLANAISCYPLTAAQIDEHGIHGSLTYCSKVGRLLEAVKRADEGAWELFLSESGSAQFFRGKVVDLDRRTTEGFARSTVILEDLDGSDSTMRIEVQNENLIAFLDGEAVITTPNLICLLDCETFEPITTEYLAYGNRVVVIGMPCAREWHRPGMLELVGPVAFGYDVDFVELPR